MTSSADYNIYSEKLDEELGVNIFEIKKIPNSMSATRDFTTQLTLIIEFQSNVKLNFFEISGNE